MNLVRVLAFIAVFSTIPVRVAKAFVAAQPTNTPAQTPSDDDGPANGQWGGQPQEVDDYGDESSEQTPAGKHPASISEEGPDNAPMDDNIDYN